MLIAGLISYLCYSCKTVSRRNGATVATQVDKEKFEIAEHQRLNGDPVTAMALYQELQREVDPSDPLWLSATHMAAICLMELGEVDMSAEWIQVQLDDPPSDISTQLRARMLRDIAKALRLADRLNEAEAAETEATALEAANPPSEPE